MPQCRRCQGEGQETYDEDGRTFTDVCYHCAGSGQVDEDLDFHDRLVAVANTLAYVAEGEYRKACNSDPEGDDYGLRAAENGLRENDYFRCQVWELAHEYTKQLEAMDIPTQELYVAWNELEQEPWDMSHLPMVPVPPISSVRLSAPVFDQDEIPF